MFTKKSNMIETRTNNKFQLPKYEVESKRRFVIFYGLKLWNSIAPTIKIAKSVESFARKVKLSFKTI